MNTRELTAAVTAVANLMAERLSDRELELLAAALTQLADTLSLIAAGRSMKCGDL